MSDKGATTSAEQNTEPTLSLCMIVRDAERSLRQALESARPFCDEIVIVDTGSQDNTIQIARKFEARVYEFQWCDDFSAARNRSLEKASCDWVFWMDADDVLPAESGQRLRRVISDCPEKNVAFWMNVEQTGRDLSNRLHKTVHAHVKLFPRDPRIRFCYRVHEQVAPSIRQLGFALKRSEASVRHANADRSPEADARRNQRNLRLLELDQAEHPNDPVVLMNLGMTYLHQPGGIPQSIEYLKQSLSGMTPGSPLWINASHFLTTAYAHAGNHEAELQTCRRALQQSPNDGTVLFRLGMLYERNGDLREAEQCYQRLFASGKLHPAVLHPPGLQIRAAIRLGRVYLKTNRSDRAEEFWQAFLKRQPNAHAVRDALQNCYIEPFQTSTEWNL